MLVESQFVTALDRSVAIRKVRAVLSAVGFVPSDVCASCGERMAALLQPETTTCPLCEATALPVFTSGEFRESPFDAATRQPLLVCVGYQRGLVEIAALSAGSSSRAIESEELLRSVSNALAAALSQAAPETAVSRRLLAAWRAAADAHDGRAHTLKSMVAAALLVAFIFGVVYVAF